MKCKKCGAPTKYDYEVGPDCPAWYDDSEIKKLKSEMLQVKERLTEATLRNEEHIFREAYNTSCLVAIMSFAKEKTDNNYALLVAEKIQKHLTKEEYERQKVVVLGEVGDCGPIHPGSERTE